MTATLIPAAIGAEQTIPRTTFREEAEKLKTELEKLLPELNITLDDDPVSVNFEYDGNAYCWTYNEDEYWEAQVFVAGLPGGDVVDTVDLYQDDLMLNTWGELVASEIVRYTDTNALFSEVCVPIKAAITDEDAALDPIHGEVAISDGDSACKVWVFSSSESNRAILRWLQENMDIYGSTPRPNPYDCAAQPTINRAIWTRSIYTVVVTQAWYTDI